MFMALVTLVEGAFSPDKESRSDAPRLFAPGIVSTQDFEYGLSMSPDGRTVYFTRGDAGFNRLTILESHLIGGQWARPKVAPFSGIWKDADAQVSPDGGTIMFISTRPMADSDAPRKDYNIWFVRRTRRGWSEPEPLDGTINTDGNEASPSMTRDGTLYFEAIRNGHAGIHVYRSQLAGGHYQEPELLGFANSANDINPIVSADGRFIIFSSRDRGGAGGGDLFITFAQSGGSWSTPRNLGEPINSKFGELSPGLSPDNQTLYFSSNRIDGPLVRVRRPTFDGLERELHGPQNGLLDVYEVRLGNLQRFNGP
jgi:Tol biopolymer transport system component